MNSQATSVSPSDPMSDGIRIVGVESFKEQMREFSKVIAARAYDIYDRRGREEGHAVEDWIRAESELRCLAPIGILESSDKLEVNFRLPGFSFEAASHQIGEVAESDGEQDGLRRRQHRGRAFFCRRTRQREKGGFRHVRHDLGQRALHA